MPRILAIDYGRKRCGLAISDPLGMIANGLETVDSDVLMRTLTDLQAEYRFEVILIGLPRQLNGELNELEASIQNLISGIQKRWPEMSIERRDERFTSAMAQQTILASGVGKQKRKDRGTLDKVSASLLLQDYLNER